MLSAITNLILAMMMTFTSVKIPVMNEKQEFQISNLLTTVSYKTENSLNLNKFQTQDAQNAKQLENHQLDIDTSDEIIKQVALEKLQAALKEEKVESQEVFEEEENLSSKQRSLKLDKIDEIDVTERLTTYTEEIQVEEESLPVYKDFRQTFYSVDSGEVKVGYGVSYNDESVRNINNVMHFFDDGYQEWLPVVAVDINEVLEVGLNKRGIPNYYGTVLEITYPSGEAQKAIVLDACGACSRDNRIDLWVYKNDYNHDIKGIEYRVIREGFKDEDKS